MNVLVACEESQEVCKAFRAKGHNAFSCDVVKCSGGRPEWHIMQDVLPLLNGHCMFVTMNDELHVIEGWDLIIAFPPCTHLAVSGARHFKQKQQDGRQQEAIDFFMKFANASCEKIAIENPVGIMSTHYRKPDQIIQPYMFGHPCKKSTCLWLKGLPKLIATDIVEPELVSYTCKNGKHVTFSKHMVTGFKSSERAKARSKTFHGVAEAMAYQWGQKGVTNSAE